MLSELISVYKDSILNLNDVDGAPASTLVDTLKSTYPSTCKNLETVKNKIEMIELELMSESGRNFSSKLSLCAEAEFRLK